MRELAFHAANMMTINALRRRGRPRRITMREGPVPPKQSGAPPGGELSKRELEVTQLVCCGMTNREIAQKLFIAERTAEGHVERIRNKLGVRSRTEVAIWATRNGLLAN